MSCRILLVDDSSLQRKMACKIIAMSGVETSAVLEAENGREALEVLDREWVDVVLTDLHMPVMSGIELIVRMGRDSKLDDIPIIVISSDRSESRMEELKKKRGVWAFIHKPFTPEAVHEVLADVLDGAKVH